MELAAARASASAAKEAALVTQEAQRLAEERVTKLEAALRGPQPRMLDDGPALATEHAWNLATHAREMTRVMRRRKMALGTRTLAPSPRDGKDGYLEHPRLGLVGAVRYWARGVVATAVMIIVALIKKLNVTELVRAALPSSRVARKAATEAAICDLMEQGFAETKHCRISVFDRCLNMISTERSQTPQTCDFESFEAF